NVAGEGFGSAAAGGEIVVGESRDGLCPAVEVDRAIRDGVGAGARCEKAGDTNGSAGGQHTGSGGTAGEVVVIESGNCLRTSAVKVDGASGNSVGIGPGGKRTGDPDRAGGSQHAAAGRAAQQVAVVDSGNRLCASPVILDRAGGVQAVGVKRGQRIDASNSERRARSHGQCATNCRV